MEIIIQIRFDANDILNQDWWAARRALEERILEKNLGRLSDAGMMDVVVRVDDVQKSRAEIEAILDELKLSDVSTIRLLSEK